MRSPILKTAGVIIAVFVALSFLAVPPASAQYPPAEPVQNIAGIDPFICGVGFVGQVTGGNGPYTANFTLVGPTTINLPPFPVGASGAYQTGAQFVEGVPPATYAVTVTFSDSSTPTPRTATTTFNDFITIICDTGSAGAAGGPGPTGDAILAAINAQRAAAAPAAQAPAQAPVPAAPAVDLAFTGGDVQLPIAIGASLVGVGGLAILFARKRSYKS